MANPKIQLRHDTAANWTSVNPILLEGEVGIETDTNKFKVGNGTTAWTSLVYGNADTEAIEQLEQDYGSLVDKVNTIETDKISFDNLNSPLSIVNNYTSRSIECDDTQQPISTNPIDPVYEADLSYYKISGTWNYKQAQWAFSHYDDGGDIVLIRVGSNNSQLRINNLPGCQNWEYHQLKITTGGAPDWSLSFTEDYKVRFSTRDLEDQIITLPDDIVQYFTSLEDKTFTTNVMLLTDMVAITYIKVQELSSKSAALSYDNNTLKINDSGQLYADVSVPSNIITTDNLATTLASTDLTSIKITDDILSSEGYRIANGGLGGGMISLGDSNASLALYSNDSLTLNGNTVYDDSMNSILSGIGMPDKTKVTNLTLGPSNTSYTAPANGYFFLDTDTNNNTGFIEMVSTNAVYYKYAYPTYTTSQPLQLMLPCLKGDTIVVTYQNISTRQAFKFIYAQGEEVTQ